MSICPKGKISKALQSIKFSLDNEGGKIKSEAMIEMKTLSAEIEEVVEVKPKKEKEPTKKEIQQSFIEEFKI